MSKNIRNESTDGLFQAILSLQDMDECYTCLLYTSCTAPAHIVSKPCRIFPPLKVR